MYQRRYQYIASKMIKGKLMMENENLQHYLPDTRPLTSLNLKEMLEQYQMVYLKPENGMKGKGIIRVAFQEEAYRLDTLQSTEIYETEDLLIESIRNLVKYYKYVIQQGVQLLYKDECPIDFRVLMQKPFDEWVYSGIMGKRGEKNSIVTNLATGGEAVPFRQILNETIQPNEEEIRNVYFEIRSLCYTIADQLTSKFPGLRELGVDIAIDPNQKIWVLEVNTTPGHQLFQSHPNKKVYRRILQNVQDIQRNT